MTQTPPRPLVEGPSAWIGRELRGREDEWIYSALRRRDRRDRERDGGGARARPRHRRDPPRRFPAADARRPARRDARRSPQRPRLRADPRPAGRGPADRRQRRRLLGHRHLFRQRPLAEREGASAGPCARSRASRHDPNVRIYQTTERQTFPHRLLRHRRAVVPEDREIGRAVVADQLDDDLQRDGDAAPRPAWRGCSGRSRPTGAARCRRARSRFSRSRSTTTTRAICRCCIRGRTSIRRQRFPEARAARTPRTSRRSTCSTSWPNDPDLRLDMQLRPGDMQFVHNHTILHDRTAFEDWPEPEKQAPSAAAVARRRPAPGRCRRFSPSATAASRSATAAASSAPAPGCTRRWSRCKRRHGQRTVGRG